MHKFQTYQMSHQNEKKIAKFLNILFFYNALNLFLQKLLVNLLINILKQTPVHRKTAYYIAMHETKTITADLL